MQNWISVNDFIDKFNKDKSYREEVIKSAKNIKSKYTEEELIIHRKQVDKLLNWYKTNKN